MVSIALEDTAYGTLVEGYESWDGFHTLQSGDTLVNISSDATSDPFSGLILKFVADGTTPADSAVVRIHVIKTGEGYSTFFVPPEAMTHQGRDALQATAEVIVMGNAKKQLKIVDHEPWVIWPYLPPVHLWIPNPSEHGRLYVTEAYPSDYNYKRGFTISVVDESGNPAPDVKVEIKHDFQQSTGGHAHGAAPQNNSPTPPQILQGIFYGQGSHGDSLSLTTDANGMTVVDSLVASQISGTCLITAYLVSNPSLKDTVNLDVQVPWLVYFGDLIFPEGGRPFTFAQTTQTALNNHPNNCDVWFLRNNSSDN